MAQKTPAELTCGWLTTDPLKPIWRGDPWITVFRFVDQSGDAGSWTWASMLRPVWGSSDDLAIECSCDESVDGADLLVTVTVTYDVTQAITRESYEWDLERRVGSVPETLFRATVPVEGDATR